MILGIIHPPTLYGQAVEKDAFKKIQIKNKFAAATKMIVEHHKDVENVKATNGAGDNRSDTFANAAEGSSKKVVVFTNGTLNQNATDQYSVKIKGLNAGDPAKNFVFSVAFVDAANENVLGSYIWPTNPDQDATTRAQAKEYALHVSGFTYDEYFDVDNLNNASFHLGNSVQPLNIRYTIFDLEVYKDLPLSNLTINSFDLVGLAQPVFMSSQVILEPGMSLDVPLGGISLSGYELATASRIKIEDLDSGETYDLVAPQGFAQSPLVSSIPTLSGWALIITALLLTIAATVLEERSRGRCL